MKVRFWGVRGSIPVPGPSTVRYGGNTPCVEISCPGEDAVVIDAGSGIRNLGAAWLSKTPKKINLFISHTHWDHIQGFPFFLPIYLPTARIQVFGPQVQISIARAFPLNLREVLTNQMDHAVFPVMFGALQAKIAFHEIGPEPFSVGGIEVVPYNLNHTVITYGYNFTWKGKRVAYQSDHEPFYNIFAQDDDAGGMVREMIAQRNQDIVEMTRGADLLIADSMYTPEEYPRYRGWGHSSIEHSVERARDAGVPRLVLFHHDPGHDDDFMDTMGEMARRLAKEKGAGDLEIIVAQEGREIEL